jgi:iron complex outermembrane receptor protein
MTGSLLTLNDVSQVAVLKGPQGTLFGRNATGGLIQVTTKTPEQGFALDGNLSYGNLNTISGGLYVNGGLTDNLAFNASVAYNRQGDGFGHNLFNGQDVNKSRTFASRAKVKWEPTSSTTVTLSGDYSKTNAAQVAVRPVDGSFNVLGRTFTGGKFDINSNVQPYLRVKQYGGSLTVDQVLGQLKLQSITAYRRSYYNGVLDYDASPAPLNRLQLNQFDDQFSQELQLQPVTAGRLSWIVGAYFFLAKSAYDPVINDGAAIPFGASAYLLSTQKTRSFAGFGQATYRIDDATHFTAGLRYTTEHRSILASEFLLLPSGANIPAGNTAGEKTFDKLTWRFALDHRFSSEMLAYVSYNRGFKSGAFVAQAFPAAVLKPETLDAYEAGVKLDLLDRRVRFNLASYYYNYKNVQVQLISRGLIMAFNGSGAHSYGLDADLTAKVTGALEFTGGVSAIHGRYTSFVDAFSTTPRVPSATPRPGAPNGGNIIGTGDATGHRLQATPDWTLNAGFNYHFETSIGRMELDGNFYHSDGWYAEVENRLRQPAYNLFNADLRWRSQDGRFGVSVFGKNLTNTFHANFLASADVADLIAGANGRTYGVTLSVDLK